MAEISKVNSAWLRSSYSGGEACVETMSDAGVHIRDSKRPFAPQLAVSPGAWAAFTSHVRKS